MRWLIRPIVCARAGATLFDHEGGGHTAKIDKASAGDAASLIFQSNYTGHGEMSLPGSTAFENKVSANALKWHTAMYADPTAGEADFPNGLYAPDTAQLREYLRTGEDLDSYVQTGFYHQGSNNVTWTCTNHPVATAGLLSVVGAGLMVYQTYHVDSAAASSSNNVLVCGAFRGTFGPSRSL